MLFNSYIILTLCNYQALLCESLLIDFFFKLWPDINHINIKQYKNQKKINKLKRLVKSWTFWHFRMFTENFFSQFLIKNLFIKNSKNHPKTLRIFISLTSTLKKNHVSRKTHLKSETENWNFLTLYHALRGGGGEG